MKSGEFYQKIEERFIQWGQVQDDVHVAYVAGSRARKDHGADEYSDLDIQMYVDDPTQFFSIYERDLSKSVVHVLNSVVIEMSVIF